MQWTTEYALVKSYKTKIYAPQFSMNDATHSNLSDGAFNHLLSKLWKRYHNLNSYFDSMRIMVDRQYN